MRKRLYGIVLCVAMLALPACGKEAGNERNMEDLTEVSSPETKDEQRQESSKDTGNILFGVYEDVSDFKEIPLGTFFEGEQKAFCQIKMPMEYLFSAIYSIDGENSEINPKASAVLIKNYDPAQDTVANDEVILGPTDGTSTYNFYIVPSTSYTMEDEKVLAEEYTEIGNENHSGIYYVHPSEYVTADVIVDYQINEDILLKISYEGPLADKLGLDQLAQNLYDLVEVIE